MKIFVTGGAGYIGSVAVSRLIKSGHEVAVYDNLSTGHKAAVPKSVEFYHGDLLDYDTLLGALKVEKPEAVMHFAAVALVGESVENPQKYMQNNVIGTLNLLNGMLASNVKKLVFSSTAATYGEPDTIPITELEPTNPTNPYGLTKRFMEQAMETYSAAYDLRFVALRYFNACGATQELGEFRDIETHLIPLVLQVALGQRQKIMIFGDDYDTPDGSCVRDYIHVLDLADAHLRALNYLNDGGHSNIFNLGNGSGFSVKEVIEACREITGLEIPAEIAPRRPGDPSTLIASAVKAREILGWEPKNSELKQVISDAWKWHQAHPNGYV